MTTPSPRPARVAFVSFAFSEYTMRLSAELARDGDVLLVAPADFADVVAPSPALEWHGMPEARLRQPHKQLANVGRLLAWVWRFKPDVVHFQHGHLWFSPVVPLLRGRRLVITVHDPVPHTGDRESAKTPQGVMRIAYRAADRLIVHGEALRDALVGAHHVDPSIVDVVPHPALGNDALHADVAEAGNEVLFFGRIWDYKGLDVLIAAQPRISAAVPDARIVIAGKGDDFAKYRGMMTDPDAFVVRNEYIDDDEAALLFRRASIVVLPYTDASQSGVVPMAYTYGRAVVASRVGGLPEVVDDGVTGVLVPARDVEALADAIVGLLQDPERRRAMGDAGRAKNEGEASMAAVAAQTRAVYARALAVPPRRRWRRWLRLG